MPKKKTMGEALQFKIGGIGCILFLIAIVIILAASFSFVGEISNKILTGAPPEDIPLPQWFFISIFFAYIILIVSLVLISVGAFGFYLKYKNTTAQVAGAIGITVVITLFIPGIAAISFILAGIFIALLGIVFLGMRGKIAGPVQAGGILAIITGVLHATVVGAVFSYFIGIPTMMILAMLFFKA